MEETQQIHHDLAYVRNIVESRRGERHLPLGIALIWSAFVLTGFTWLDFNPRQAAWFLTLGGLVAFLLSGLVGARAGWRFGEKQSVRKHMVHWGGFFLSFAAVLCLAVSGHLGGRVLGQVILILSGLAYFYAGVHLAPRLFVWLGPLMMAGAVGLNYIEAWGWTTMGVVISIGLLASSFAVKRDDA